MAPPVLSLRSLLPTTEATPQEHRVAREDNGAPKGLDARQEPLLPEAASTGRNGAIVQTRILSEATSEGSAHLTQSRRESIQSEPNKSDPGIPDRAKTDPEGAMLKQVSAEPANHQPFADSHDPRPSGSPPPAAEFPKRVPESPPAARTPPAMPNLMKPPQTTSTSQIAIRLDSGTDAGQVVLRIRERAGEVQIAVQSTDQGVATTLRQDLGDLVKRLESHGSYSDSIRQEGVSSAEPGSHSVSHVPGGEVSRGYSYFSDDAQQQRQRQQQQQQSRPHTIPQEATGEALEELSSTWTDFTNGAHSS